MGVRSTLISTALAASHTSAAFKAGRNAPELVTQAETQILDVIKTLQEIIKDMQTGDSNIAAFNTLISNLS
jgi:hypothetical protein